MKMKRTSGIAALIIGLVLLVFYSYATSRINAAKDDVNAISSILPKSTRGNPVTNTLEGKLSAYDTFLTICLFGGVVLVAAGAWVLLIKKKRK